MHKRTAIVFGAGNIGRGFIGQLFSESGYHVVFSDVDAGLIEALDKRGEYCLETVFNDDVKRYVVGPVSAIDARDVEAVAAAVAAADIGATAVGKAALPLLAEPIVRGLRQRLAAAPPGRPPLNILLCENVKQAADKLRSDVAQCLTVAERRLLDAQIGFVDTVIGRMVPPPTPEMRAADPGLIRVEPYKELPVNREQFVGPIPNISAMIPESGFERYTARKLYIHNCGHALLAYAGYVLGYEYGYQALADPHVLKLLIGGLRESKSGIARRYDADPTWLQQHIDDLLTRFGNRALGDTIFRLGRDPIRKLSSDDRLVGAARLADASDAPPECLSLGIACALFFGPAGDPSAQSLQTALRADGIAVVLEKIAGIGPHDRLGRMIAERYRHMRPDPPGVFKRIADEIEP